jgi:hypothetical protein
MVGWLTALLIALIAVSALSLREHATFRVPPPPGTGNTAVSSDYQSMLEAYETNYKMYVRTSEPSIKVALDQLTTHIEKTLDGMRTDIDRNQVYIQSFLDKYENINPEMVDLRKKARSLKEAGPKIGDELVVSTQESPMPVDYGALTVRIVILTVILGAALAINSFA